MTSFLDFYKKRPVLITGGAGFIGSHLTHALVQAGAQVTLLDNFSTGSLEALSDILHKITIIVGDITEPATCQQATRGKTHVFHLAAAISVEESTKNPLKYHAVNVTGTKNILEAAHKNNVKRLIFSSSAAVYGNTSGLCHENAPVSPTSPYAHSKVEGEILCQKFNTTTRLETIILRYFNVFGERQKTRGGYGAVIPTFISKIKQGQPITIFGTGHQTRDFVAVEEIVRANLIAGCSPYPTDPIINVASGKSTSLLQLIDDLVKKVGTAPPLLTFAEARAGDVLHSQADCNRYVALKKIVEDTYGPAQK